MIPEVLAEADQKMQKSGEALTRDLAAIRTSRAAPALVENLLVEYYGTPTPLKQLAGISTPEARLIVIQPWDRTVIQAIEKAILKSNLGMTPSNDGHVIRLPVPSLTEERRHDLVKVVRKRMEEGRQAIRNLRRDAVEALRKLEAQKQLSQDELKRASDQVQRLHDKHIAMVENVGESKEADLLQV